MNGGGSVTDCGVILPVWQRLAEETGGNVSDSLDMARFGHEHPVSTLVVAGVRFMGETAMILNPEKRVLGFSQC